MDAKIWGQRRQNRLVVKMSRLLLELSRTGIMPHLTKLIPHRIMEIKQIAHLLPTLVINNKTHINSIANNGIGFTWNPQESILQVEY